MALDPMLLHTNGLDPSFAKSRNSNHVAQLASCTLGPMPPQQFLDYFLPQEAPYDETHRLSSRYAFNSIPSSANDPVDIYIPLVSVLTQARVSDITYLHSGQGIEPKDQVQVALPRIRVRYRSDA